jgi:hypothetical protein
MAGISARLLDAKTGCWTQNQSRDCRDPMRRIRKSTAPHPVKTHEELLSARLAEGMNSAREVANAADAIFGKDKGYW